MKPFRIISVALVLGAVIALSGCAKLIPRSGQNLNQPSAGASSDANVNISILENWEETTEPDYSSITQLNMVVTEKTIRELEKYTNLKTLDLSGSTCYTAIMVYMQNHPQVEVTYDVDFGGTSAISWAEQIAIPSSTGNFRSILKNLVYLPNLQMVHLPKTELSVKEIALLRDTYPDISITYTVGFRGVELNEDIGEINLADITADEIPQVIAALERLPSVAYAELMNNSGFCNLSRQEVKLLVEALPNVRFHYVFNLFGKTVSTTDTQISFKSLGLQPSAETEIREALSIMSPGSTLILDNCGLSNELLDSIRADYTEVDLVWRVFFGTEGRYTTLTNDDTIRCVYNVTDETCYPMRYLRNVKYMDLGHNDTLTDLSFVGFMPDLEILIVSGCAASDLSGFENCKKLEFLELANCMKLTDLSPLAGCSGLKYLNICYTKVSSLMPLDGLSIENLFCKQTRVPAEEQKQFKEIHPDATAVFSGKDPYAGPGWRYTDNGYHYTEFYKKVREAFNLDEVDKILRAQQKANGG